MDSREQFIEAMDPDRTDRGLADATERAAGVVHNPVDDGLVDLVNDYSLSQSAGTRTVSLVSMTNLSSETWLLTGANGKIGRQLRHHLRKRLARLVVADRLAPPDSASNEVAVSFDLNDFQTVASLMPGCDGVIHLAGIADEAPYADLLRVNALGTYHVLESMRLAGVPRLVYASSNRITGFHSTNELLDDRSTVRPDGLYGASKAAAEALTRMYADKFGIRVCNVRIGSLEETPTSQREAATWLSPSDANLAFESAMTTSLPFSVFYAVSANRYRFWSLEPGRAIGYVPNDDASTILGDNVYPPDNSAQAGDFANAEYTLPFLSSSRTGTGIRVD